MSRALKLTLVSLYAAFCLSFVSSHAASTDEWRREQMSKSVFPIYSNLSRRQGGTAFTVRSRLGTPYTMTNHHLCERSTTGMLRVVFKGFIYSPRILVTSEDVDLCILESIPGSTPIELGKIPAIGQHITVYGHPFMRPLSVVEGFIIGDSPYIGIEAYTLDLPIYPGNSGSPAVNSRGRLVGVVFAREFKANFGYLVPLRSVLAFLAGR